MKFNLKYKYKYIISSIIIIILLFTIITLLTSCSNSNNIKPKEVEIQVSLTTKEKIKAIYIFEDDYKNKMIFEESGKIYRKYNTEERYRQSDDTWEQEGDMVLFTTGSKTVICYIIKKENKMFHLLNDYKYEYKIVEEA